MAWQTNVPGLRNLHDKYFIVHLLHYLSPAFCHVKFQNTFTGNFSSGGQALFSAKTSIVLGSLTRFFEKRRLRYSRSPLPKLCLTFCVHKSGIFEFLYRTLFRVWGAHWATWMTAYKLQCSCLSFSATCHHSVLNLFLVDYRQSTLNYFLKVDYRLGTLKYFIKVD